MKKDLSIILSLAIIAIIVVSTLATIEIYMPSTAVTSKKPFYVGVTYCGDSVDEAKQLVDKVKNYTNLFVLQSGPLMYDVSASEEICDYAVQSGLYIIISGSTNSLGSNLNTILSIANESWGSHFLGLYFNDEPAGRMLDSSFYLLNDKDTGISIAKNSADIIITFGNQSGMGLNTIITQYAFGVSSGTITKTTTISTIAPHPHDSPPTITNITINGTPVVPDETVYYPNGTITYATDKTLIYEPNGTVFNENGQIVTDQGNISKFEPYQQVWNLNPLLNSKDVADLYENNLQSTLSSIGNQSKVRLFTSDYALYWFDYQGGYNSVFAELFGTQTDAQTLALVRGAADMQRESWGVMVEPASQSPLNLQTGDQIFNELKQAYEDGAEFGVVFNYAPAESSNTNIIILNPNGTQQPKDSGLLQDEQFNAIQKFWTEVVQNPDFTNNVKGQAVLVLPSNYGSGLRTAMDTIWGIWQSDSSSQQIWNATQAAVAKYGTRLDIIYENPNIPLDGKYQHIAYWNTTI